MKINIDRYRRIAFLNNKIYFNNLISKILYSNLFFYISYCIFFILYISSFILNHPLIKKYI